MGVASTGSGSDQEEGTVVQPMCCQHGRLMAALVTFTDARDSASLL